MLHRFGRPCTKAAGPGRGHSLILPRGLTARTHPPIIPASQQSKPRSIALNPGLGEQRAVTHRFPAVITETAQRISGIQSPTVGNWVHRNDYTSNTRP